MKIFGKEFGKVSKPTPKTKPKPALKKVTTDEKGEYGLFGHKVTNLANEQGTGSSPSTGDYQSRYERPTLVNLMRKMMDENIFVSSMADRLCTNLMGANGFSLQARTGDPEINALIEKEIWPRFTSRPEYRDMFNWTECQYGVCQDAMFVGDIGAIKLRNGQLQMTESEWINSPNQEQIRKLNGLRVEQGVAMTNGGKLRGFFVTPPDTFGQPSPVNAKYVKSKDFIYVNAPVQRFSRTRPLPPFIQCMSSVWRLDDILDSEAYAWELLSKYAIIINKDNATEDGYALSDERTDISDNDSYITDRATEIDGGTLFWGNKGETVSGVNRNLPGKDFPGSLRAFVQMFSMRLGLPLEILMLDWSKTNFSSGKAALSQASTMIRRYQAHIIDKFHKRVYEWVISRAIAEGYLEETPDIYTHEWFPPVMPWINPKDEAEGYGIMVDRGIVNYNDVLKMNGKDIDTENDTREKIIREAIDRSKKIEEDTGVSVPYQSFTGQTVGLTQQAVADEKDPGSEEDDDQDDEVPEDEEDDTKDTDNTDDED